MRYAFALLLTVLSGEAQVSPQPAVYQSNQGDRWLLLGQKLLIFKTDPVTTHSQTLVIGTEVMPPGNVIPVHMHLNEDEAVFVHEGNVRVSLAGRNYDANTGATVFIPRRTWIGIQNTSHQPATIVFIFNTPKFERCLRALSSREGRRFVMPPPETMTATRASCDQVIKSG